MGEIIGDAGASLRDASWARTTSAASVGRVGERYSAAELVAAVERGAVVLHDVAVPVRAISANIDHVVVAGSTVTLIDSKHWKPGIYWTRGGRTRRNLELAPHCDKKGMATAANAIDGLLRRRGIDFTLDEPITTIWSTGSTKIGWYKPHRGRALTGPQLARWTRTLPHDTASTRIVEALRPLVKGADQ